MRFQTKKSRLLAVIDAYRKKHGAQPFPPNAAMRWALAAGLYPVPKRGDPPEVCEAWERRLEAATAG